ncbi:MAG: hypothetical protein K2X81_24045 [Candidatus Obscuribacterales bacterium]|nr:hypothetical protein [Candidatus Obscuribacterales bacterium]
MNKMFALLIAMSTVGFCASPSLARHGGEFAQHHPRRAEVLHRDHNENRRLNHDRGQLNGHYRQLKHEDRAIHRQERHDKNMNGGYITKAQQAHLNHEENRLNRQIRRYN